MIISAITMVIKASFNARFVVLLLKKNNNATKPLVFKCPYCGHTLIVQKERKNFRIHKCKNPKCTYYLRNLKKIPKDFDESDKHKYKLMLA